MNSGSLSNWNLTAPQAHCAVYFFVIAPSPYSGVLDPDGLRVYKGVRTKVRQLATVAAVLDAAHGNARVRGSDPVDENTARVEIARHFASQLDVSGPEIAAQTELAGIGRTNGRINVWHAGQRS